MRNLRFLITAAFSLGFAGTAQAVPCDGAETCERPGFNATTQSGWTISASGVSGIKSLVSVGPTGNVPGSQYYFGVSNANLGATVASGGFTPGGSGARVISTAFTINGTQTPGSTVFGGAVQQVLGSTAYFFYAQACPTGTGIYNSAGCSSWTLIGNTSTLAYPTNVFAAPTAPGDSSVNTLNVRKNVPAADVPNVSLIRVDIHDLITPANNQTLLPIGFGGANGVQTIDSSLYTQNGGFKPNVKYEYLGKVVYPFSVDVPAAGQTRGPIWTRPVNPGPVAIANITHCSVQITAQNSSGNPANPAYTVYNLCASGTGGSCATDQISGATSGSTAQITVTNLLPGTNYTPQATALVGNGDGSSTGWGNSGTTSGTGFATLAFNGSFVINNVSNTSADGVVSGVNTTGLSTWQIRLNGNAVANGTAADLNGTHALSGLTPNTIYAATIVLTEASGCSSTLNFSPGSFTTTPIAPTAPAGFPGNTFNSLTMNWTDSSANPAASVYEAQLCTDAGFTAGCQTNTVTKPVVSTTFSGLSANVQYFGRVRTRNVSRPTWPDSAWFTVGSATTGGTPGPVFVTQPDLTVYVTSGIVSALGDDPGPDPESTLIYTWTVQSPLGATISVSPNGTNAAKNAVVTFNTAGTYILLCTISNNNGSLPLATPARQLNQVLKAITVSPNNITINAKTPLNFSATGLDQFGHPMALPAVNWNSLDGGNITGSGLFSPGGVGLNIRITATHNGVTGTASINVVDFDISGAKAYPVPYKSTTGAGTIHFTGLGTDAKIRIYTTSGRLVFETAAAGPTYDWNVRNTSGESIASGVYLYVIENPSTTKNGKLIIIQ